jgi:hypothetical protein
MMLRNLLRVARCLHRRSTSTARYFLASGLILWTMSVSEHAEAEGEDRAAALQHFKDALRLKDAGKCDAAIPVFHESIRLDKQPKALMQLADCEEATGKWSHALQHWRDARDQASLGTDPVSQRQREVAEQRMNELDVKLPRLTIVLAPNAPADAEIARDGVRLGKVSLNKPLPIDPGKHVVSVVAARHEPRQWEVTLAQGEQRQLEVGPGARRTDAATPGPHAVQAPSAKPSPLKLRPDSSLRSGNGQRIAGIVVGAAGLAAGAVAGGLWLSARAKHNEAVDDHCRGGCAPTADELQAEALDRAKLARIVGIAGGVVLGAGIVLFATAPSHASPSARVTLSPAIGQSDTRLYLRGQW